MKFFACATLLAASITVVATAADATVTLNISQVGPDVVASASGSLNLTGLTEYESSTAIAEAINPSVAFSEVGDGSQRVNGFVGLISSPSNFGAANSTIFSSSISGDPFAVYGASGLVWLPDGYASGGPIAATATWSGQSIASLGLAPGAYTFIAPGDSLIVKIEPAPGAVPEPATWAMMLLGLGAIGLSMRSRRRPAALASD
jgi:hypothetical protein